MFVIVGSNNIVRSYCNRIMYIICLYNYIGLVSTILASNCPHSLCLCHLVHRYVVNALWAPSGRLFVTGSYDHSLCVYR